MAQAMDTEIARKNGRARSALQARTRDVIDDFGELRKDVGRLAKAANKAARVQAKHTGRRLGQIGGDIRTRASESADYAVTQVREHPATALGISLGAGLLLGMLLARR